MNGLDVDAFISSQRSKLKDEKSKLQTSIERRGRVRGILPSDSVALEKTDKLRRERHLEYQAHIKNRGGGGSMRRAPQDKPISEIRRNMSREREQEITRNGAELESRNNTDYKSLRERKLAEERRYQRGMYDYDDHERTKKRRNWRDTDTENDPGHTRMPRQHSSWAEEENELIAWSRNQAHVPPVSGRVLGEHNPRARTPPAVDSLSVNASKSSLRSVSAPVVASGIAALGAAKDDPATKRLRQMKYAEELRNQMKEKDGGGAGAGQRPRGRPRDKSRDEGANPPAAPAWQHEADPEKRLHSPGHRYPRSRREDDFSPRHHRHGDEEEEERRMRKYPPRPSRPSKGDQYDYYQEPYGPPPPPPPRFQGGYDRRWGPPYYPYPPPPAAHDYDRTPYADVYFPPYPRGYRDPYAPPPRSQRPRPSDPYWDEREYRRSSSDDDEAKEAKKLHWKDKPSLHSKKSEKEPGYSAGISSIGDNSDGRSGNKSAYRRELEDQIKEKRERGEKEKIAKEKIENKAELEIYDPFGKGGCGAPVRDQFGNLVADLKQMRHINENRLSNNSPLSQRQSKEGAGALEIDGTLSAQNSPRTTILRYDKTTEENAKKASQENYRDYLKQQVREKEELKRKEKERQKLEEERELEQLERDRKRLQEEYQREMERQKRKEEEARSKNEAIKREAELKRQMAIMQQEQEMMKEEAERRALVEARMPEAIADLSLSPARARPDSPPVPTLRHKMKKNFSNPPPSTPDRPEQAFRSSSPPVPTLRKKLSTSTRLPSVDDHADSSLPVPAATERRTSRQPTTSADVPSYHPRHEYSADLPRKPSVLAETRDPHPAPVTFTSLPPSLSPPAHTSSAESEQNKLLTQLGAIRMHLQAELAKQTGQSSDIFDRAKQQKPKIAAPKVPRQTQRDSPSLSALNDFSQLKYSDPTQRSKFLEEFPELPASDSALELQQAALLRHQEASRKPHPHRERPDDHTRTFEGPKLQVQTTQVPLDSANPFADNISRSSVANSSLENLTPRINEPRRRPPTSPGGISKLSVNTMNTVNTVDVDNMAMRNEERMRRLEAILNAGPPRQASVDSLQQYPSGPGVGEGRFNSTTTLQQPPAGPRARARARGGVASRQSEFSLDCDIQHLPAS